jgi:glycosyltransferase involved in cell wall biosynthesis
MLLLDLTHTSHTQARTGAQRVARALQQNLGASVTAVTRDPFLGAWRVLESWELANLARSRGGPQRGPRWQPLAKWRSHWRRVTGRTARHALQGEYDGLIEPELFSAKVARDLFRLVPQVRGPRVAVFFDAVALRFPELTPPSTVAWFPSYLRELLLFDGIAAISEESRESLTGYWRWLGVTRSPPVTAIPLGVDRGNAAPDEQVPSTSRRPVVLTIGTLEGRKNHVSLFEACEQLWARGRDFELRLIGHVNAETGRGALARARALQAAGRPLHYDGPADDEEIARAYAACAFTIYPSIAEGFGLPVIESLQRGKPCICSARGAVGESARGGGCIALDAVDPRSIAGAMDQLLASPAELAALAAAARARTFKTWSHYARELTTWMQSLPHR